MAIHLLNLQQYCGIHLAMIYCRPILKEIVGANTSKYLQISIILLKIACSLITLKALSRVGNKSLVQIGVFSCTILNVMIAIGFTLSGTAKSFLVAGSVLALMLVFNFTAGPVLWGYVPSIVPPKVIPYATFVHWLSVSLMLFLFPVVQQHVEEMYIFMFLATLSLAALFVNQLLMVDTKDLSQQKINEEFDRLFKI